MWKTLYDMCTGSPDEQQLYHSISTVATLLLQIGEVGKQYKSRPSSASLLTDGTPAAASPIVQPITSEQQPEVKVGSGHGCHLSPISPTDHDPLNDLITVATGEDNSGTESLTQECDKLNLSPANDVVTQGSADLDLSGRMNRSHPDPDWSINFEQFLASMLTESHLVAIFEKDTNVKSLSQEFRSRRLKSSADEESVAASESPPLVKGIKIL